MASSIGLVGVLSQPTSPIRQENYGGFNSSIFKMKKELNEVKNKLVYNNNKRHLLQSKIEFQMQKIKKKEVEYRQFKGRIEPDSGINTEGYKIYDKLMQQLEKQDQVQFYQMIKHELQVEEYQQLVKKFYQQQKLAIDFPIGPIYPNGPYSGRNSSIFKMKEELNVVKNKLVYIVYSNNERHLLQSKIEFQMQKIKKKEVEYKQFKGRIKSNSGIDTEGYESDDPRNVQLTKADLKIGKPSIDPGTKLVAYNSEYVSRMFGFRNHQRNGINRTVMGPHRKSRKRLEEFFKKDEPNTLELPSALQSNLLHSKRTQDLDQTFKRQSPAPSAFEHESIKNSRMYQESENESKTSIHVSNLHPDVTEEMLLEKFSIVGPVQSIRVFESLYVACINFEQQYDGKTYIYFFFIYLHLKASILLYYFLAS